MPCVDRRDRQHIKNEDGDDELVGIVLKAEAWPVVCYQLRANTEQSSVSSASSAALWMLT